MKRYVVLLLWLIASGCKTPGKYVLTLPDRSSLLALNKMERVKSVKPGGQIIRTDEKRTYQTAEGFGFTLTGGSAYLIRQKLSEEKRKALLKELFSPEGMNMQWIRISIGASDLSAFPFTYQDDPSKAFDLSHDKEDLIPLLQEIFRINPKVKLIATPWTAPLWMKDNRSYTGGKLLPAYYEAYARYLTTYMKEMKALGLPVYAMTPQNEPENGHNNPSMLMTAEEQAEFIGRFLGPEFQKSDIHTKIIVFDHNCDHPEYPVSVMSDPLAGKYVSGSAFHLYGGGISALSKVHEAFPDKHIYFTEQWTSSEGNFGGDLHWHIRNVLIGSLNNWSEVVMEWNLANDPQMKPHTEGGCDKCLGAITIGEDSIHRNVAYYIIAHASGWVSPGSVRIFSDQLADYPNVVFLRPDGKKVMMILNATKEAQYVYPDGSQELYLLPGAVATVLWK